MIWFSGYIIITIGLALLYQAYIIELYNRRQAIIAGIAFLFLLIKWLNQVFLIPINQNGKIAINIVFPQFIISCFYISLGLVLAWLLLKIFISKPLLLWKFDGR